jgi:DNA-directed RNA polymerase specialized sigma24 family protein
MITSTEAGERDYSVLYLRHGFPEALKVFFFEYYSELFSFSQMLLQQRAAARQITMEAFFLLWDKRTGFDSARTIKAFLYLTVRNKCLQHLKTPGDASSLTESVPSSLPPELLRQLVAFAATTV